MRRAVVTSYPHFICCVNASIGDNIDMKRKYVTLLDRVWKGKLWLTSFRSHKITRSLTDEEAKPLLAEGTIKEVLPLEPFIPNLVLGIDGQMTCALCGHKGFYIHKVRNGKQSSWYDIFKCAGCGKRCKKLLYIL